MRQQKNKNIPNIKTFTKSELRDDILVPEFQRWIVDKNLKELKESIESIGLLRCPVICQVSDKNETYIIDGNHLRTLIIEDESIKDNDLISCIYNEEPSFSEAAIQFKLLNTKGKSLDWIDITHLYKNVYGESSIYSTIWSILGNPNDASEVKKITGFTLPTIIELLCGDKSKYRNGESSRNDIKHFKERIKLVKYLIQYAESKSWDKTFTEEERRPSGAAIIGFVKYWFSNDLQKKYDTIDFIDFINEIYKKNQKGFRSGMLVINRDNAGNYLKAFLEKEKQIETV